MQAQDVKRFANLSYDDFRARAVDESLSDHEKIGFPDSYREGFEQAIFDDIVDKLPALRERGRSVLEIGPGCAGLPRMLQDLCDRQGHTLVVVDSPEMLDRIPVRPFVVEYPGYFPNTPALIENHRGGVEAILAYSVVQYVAETDVTAFLDRALELLGPGGSMLIGDIPNASKRKRFLSSEAGVEFNKQFTGTDEPPRLDEPVAADQLDDSVVLALLERARRAGCDAYVVPQPDGLPMANRREDILIRKP
jgi:cyclopropane fatty-acyl-phospholipid synthase-like methyltransferase